MSPAWIVLALLPILGGAGRFNCKTRILGAYYADAKSGCKAFHVCVRVAGGGVRDFRFFCPPGTLFHQEAQTCTDWGDDDPLACPAEIYDGQFDLYKIGSGFDTKKLSSLGNREEESEFGLQRAESGDRRSQGNPSAGSSDLRAAHSSDFFSGQRDRGRDDPVPQNTPSSSIAPRQSFRRPSTTRTPSSPTTQYTQPPAPPKQSNPPQYDNGSKRKLIRKRPVHVSTPSPSTTFSQNTPQSKVNYEPKPNYSEKQNYQENKFYQEKQNYQEKPNYPEKANYPDKPNYPEKPNYSEKPNYPDKPNYPEKPNFSQPQQSTNFDRRLPPPAASQQFKPTPAPPANVPPQYKDEYVEVPRVTPKQPRFYSSNQSPTPFVQSTPAPFNKKDNIVEVYNIDAQSTPGSRNEKINVRNSFNVSPDVPKIQDYSRRNGNGRSSPTTNDYSSPSSRGFATSTPAYRNINSVSYEPEKKNYNNQFSSSKQNYFNSPTTSPTTTYYTTTGRAETPYNLNTVAYNTNIGFNAQNNNFAENDEDDGQYRPPSEEDDGQYRPELYERELLSGAHSLNIAASGNRLPEDQKPHSKTQPPPKAVSQHTAAPRPFRPAPTPSSTVAPRTETTYAPTTYKTSTFSTHRPFDYFQPYTTTSRPSDVPTSTQNILPVSKSHVRPTTLVPRAPEYIPNKQRETRPPTSPPQPPTSPPQPPPSAPQQPHKKPSFAKPSHNKEDNSYDYAYYDSDTGFSEYDNIEEFGKTKTKL